MITTNGQPTICLRIGESYIAFSEKGEVLETTEQDDDMGWPDWNEAGICDARGAASAEGFKALYDALTLAEANARDIGLDIVRVPD